MDLEDPTAGKTRRLLPNGEVVHFPVGMRQEAALELVEPGHSLLDVGCGRGAVAAILAERFDRVCGVDADAESLSVAARRGVETAQLDVEQEPLPFEDESFDAVLCLEVIEHVVDPSQLARELARVLRSSGSLYLSTPNIRCLGYLRELVIRGRFPLTSEDPRRWQGGHIHFFTSADLTALLEASGFEEIRHRGVGSETPGTPRARRLAARVLGRNLAREFLAGGIFTIARRAPGKLRPTRETAHGLRAS